MNLIKRKLAIKLTVAYTLLSLIFIVMTIFFNWDNHLVIYKIIAIVYMINLLFSATILLASAHFKTILGFIFLLFNTLKIALVMLMIYKFIPEDLEGDRIQSIFVFSLYFLSSMIEVFFISQLLAKIDSE